MTYYCSACADALELRPLPPTSDFLASQYQRDKHHKHTVPEASYPVQSVFYEPSAEYYQATINEAYRLGSLEVTSRGTDVLFCPSAQSSIGYKQRYGAQLVHQDTVRLVRSDQSLEAHAFLNSVSDHSTYLCTKCGGLLFMNA